ncbi:MAG: phenylalanine--tRNA ligase subunit beta [Gammaproteobacteria bacterium]|nr:phenylalanine--tRNA ligase subunit beta [Gammaproteobacteria bacterium]MDH3767900.1 phenylalanine--tRNA ligase subunit beta [Gammaproteobacteria bacterium]
MRFSEAWLREWVDPPVDTRELASQLTMAGLEVAGVEPAAPGFSDVVLGHVDSVEPHPNADKLRVCQVNVGASTEQIVCGASNVAAGQFVAVARVGAQLPGGVKVGKENLRGIESGGMICSAKELGMGEDADGIMVLPKGGRIGNDLRDHLSLDDLVIEVELTPNRGDCLGLAGIAREVAVINRTDINRQSATPVPAKNAANVPVSLEDEEGCPIFAGRVVRGIDSGAATPLWMQERLRRSGIRPISPVVDVTNYVMLESGQPMHAYDLRNLDGGIVVRRARAKERLKLLDGREIELDDDVLAITDDSGVIGLAGIMGGENSGVQPDTKDIFFEAAFFAPLAIAGRARRFGMHTDASHRFERGVEPGGQLAAVERATLLLTEIAGGEPGPAEVVAADRELQPADPVRLRRSQLDRLLGAEVPDDDVFDLLTRLEMQVKKTKEGWLAIPPAFRFDIAIEADLIEEVARLYGYDRIPEVDASEQLAVMADTEARVRDSALEAVLVDRGYREVVTYSFVDPALQRLLSPDDRPLELSNPISADLSVMRTSLMPGLIHALKQNLSRQHERARLFESGLRYIQQGDDLKQEKCLSGVIYGAASPEHWSARTIDGDFFDLKGDIQALIELTGEAERFVFEPAEHPSLHPGQTARLLRDGREVGSVGALHPGHQTALGLAKPAYLFEILVEPAFAAKIPAYREISRYPSVRRDISLLVDESVSAATVMACVRRHAPEVLRQIRIFDVYRGQRIDSGRKSIALGLILQDYCSTLTDGEADSVVTTVSTALVEDLNAKIRD